MIKVATPSVDEAEVAAVRDVLLSGNYVSGKTVKAFEEEFAAYVGVEHAVAVNSGTASLHAALVAIDLQPGDEVIVPALTFFSTATAVIHQGGIPIFADISLDNYCMCPADLRTRITPRTKAIIPVHFYGHATEMDEVMAIAKEHGLYVIEDCAQSHGTLYRGTMTGAIGDMGSFSFFATKHMTTGEGGIVTTNNAEWAQKMRIFRSHGLVGRHDHVMLGYNYRMTEIAAAIGRVQLTKLPQLNADRIKNCQRLSSLIADIPWLKLPEIPEHVLHTYFWLHILIDEEKLGYSAQELIGVLAEKGVQTRNRYVAPLSQQPLLTKNMPALMHKVSDHVPDYAAMSLPNTEKVAGKVLGLPNRPDLTEAEIQTISDVLHSL